MKLHFPYRYLLGFSLLLSLNYSCATAENQLTSQERIVLQVEEKIHDWKQRRDAKCHKAALSLAIEKADSLILAYAFEQKLQLERPTKPIRPDAPPLLRPNDSLELSPFLNDSL